FRITALAALAAGCSADPGEDTGATDADQEALAADTVCTGKPVEVVVYSQDGFTELADAFDKHQTPCGRYFLSLPALAEHKDMPRGGVQPKLIRDHGRNFHAMAEFHWGGWRDVPGLTWFQKGV